MRESLNGLQLWWLGLTCHAYRNRGLALFTLAVAVPLLTVAALRVGHQQADLRPQVLR